MDVAREELGYVLQIMCFKNYSYIRQVTICTLNHPMYAAQ